MTDYQCRSCSYGSNNLDELRQHLHQTGHVGIREKDGIETSEVAEALEDAEPIEGKSSKGKVAAKAGLGFLAVTTAIGVVAWKYKGLAAENGELKSMAGRLAAELAKLVADNEYLRSASGAGTMLNSFRGR